MNCIGPKAFENPSYRKCLLDLIDTNYFSRCDSEEDIRKAFENVTNNILRTIGAINNDEFITFKSEVATENGRRIDSKYKNIIIEYKKYKRLSNKKDHEEAIKQLHDYMNDSQFTGKSVYGILFDGYILEFYFKDGHDTFSIPNDSLNGIISTKNLDYYFKIAFSSSKKEISSYCLMEDFNINSQIIKDTFKILYNALVSPTNSRTKLMLDEWEKMFKLSESDNSSGDSTHPDILERRKVLADLVGSSIDSSEKEYMAIFSLHTLFSIILKIILCKSVNEFKNILNGEKIESLCLFGINDLKEFFINLESGNTLKSAGLINMIEGDFFSWYIKENNLWQNDFCNKLKTIIATISEYEDIRIKKYSLMQDLFRELYESFIPHIIRHCFGEYYTPYWLAENVLFDAVKDKDVFCSVMDPCCGSGTFLIAAINRRIKHINKNGSDEKVDFNFLTKGIFGIDLNPLAVLMARINLFINIAPYINDYNEIEIPVYNGDSTYSPTIENIDGVDMLCYSLNTTLMNDLILDITFPYEFVKSNNFLSVIDKLETYVLLKNEKGAIDYFIKEVEKIVALSNNLKKILCSEVNKLIELEKKELNGIWLRIFANYLKTGILPKLDCIVGNPPWVRWNVLPENYRKTVKEKCKLDGLFSDDKNCGGVDLNICALIANKCCEKWLDSNGRLSFLMPQNLLFNKSFQGFRNLEINYNNERKRCYFESIKNWSEAGNPFGDVQELFCTYNITFKIKDYKNGIPEIVPIKMDNKKLKNNSSWDDVSKHFKEKEKILCIFDDFNNNFTSLSSEDAEIKDKINKITGENEYNFRKGVDAMAPMRLTFIRNVNNQEAEFYTWKKDGGRLKRTDNKEILETKYIKPFITAPMILKNEINWKNEYVICCYDNTNVPVSLNKLIAESPKLASYLNAHAKELSNRSSFNKRIQNNKEYYALLRMGMYSFADYFVVIRDNTKFLSSVVGKIKTAWGKETSPIFDGHVSYISEKIKGTTCYISYDEAKYINAILNLNICVTYIMSSVSSRSIGTRFRIRIPKYKDDIKFKDFLKIHGLESDSLLKTEEAYFNLLDKIDNESKEHELKANNIDFELKDQVENINLDTDIDIETFMVKSEEKPDSSLQTNNNELLDSYKTK